MKQYFPLIVTIIVIFGFVGISWFEIQSGKPGPDETPTATAQPASNISGKSLNEAAAAATEFVSNLSIKGKIPLTSDNLPTSPSPLFESVR